MGFAPNWKPEKGSHKRAKNRKRRQFRNARKTCRAARYAKDGECCVQCGRWLVLNPSEARHEFEIANIHEVKFRSRGGSAIDVNNTTMLCYRCHEKAHGR